ncbi:MAG: ABC transporter substrate-binding protein [Angelakisella sp.]|nr:ABC transporter substrate-binding protein [Angelakisella sp.]
MKASKMLRVLATVLCFCMVFTACGGSTTPASSTPASSEAPAPSSESTTGALDLNALTLDQIIEGAKKEGKLESVGMPGSWANWQDTWDALEKDYGLDHNDTDMSSAEELNMFETEKNAPTKDIGDVGHAFGPQAIEMGVVQSYKTSYWDSVPDWAKDKDGLWMMAYTGVTSFITNTDLVKNPPKSWADVKAGDYKMTIGDVVTGATGQGVVLATAYAFGGGMDNLDPAFEFWAEMAEKGRIDQGDILLQRIQAGEVQCGVTWSFNVFSYRDKTPNYKFDICVPSDGAIMSGYASVINKYAPHPHAAALAREYIFSDAGQANLAKAGGIPTRTDVTIPAEIEAATFSKDMYKDAHPVTDPEAYNKVREEIARRWQEEIIPLMS